jgi:TolA-binding protein
VLETASDRDGHFVLEALGPGTYRVDIEAPDHQAAHVGIHIPESGGPPGPLEVHLWPVTTAARPEKEPPPSAPAVASSAHSPAPAATTPEDAASEASPQGASEVPAAPDSVPSEAAGHVGLADAVDRALAASQVPRAVALLEGVPEKRAADAELFFRVGDALLRSGETAEATRVLDEALDRDPDHVGARYARALARLGTGQLEGAREDFRRLLQLQPEGPYAEKARAALGELGAPAR